MFGPDAMWIAEGDRVEGPKGFGTVERIGRRSGVLAQVIIRWDDGKLAERTNAEMEPHPVLDDAHYVLA